MTWVLVVMITVGAFGRGGVVVTPVAGFLDQQECKRAGDTVKVALGGPVREVEYVCVVQTVEQQKGK